MCELSGVILVKHTEGDDAERWTGGNIRFRLCFAYNAAEGLLHHGSVCPTGLLRHRVVVKRDSRTPGLAHVKLKGLRAPVLVVVVVIVVISCSLAYLVVCFLSFFVSFSRLLFVFVCFVDFCRVPFFFFFFFSFLFVFVFFFKSCVACVRSLT